MLLTILRCTGNSSSEHHSHSAETVGNPESQRYSAEIEGNSEPQRCRSDETDRNPDWMLPPERAPLQWPPLTMEEE